MTEEEFRSSYKRMVSSIHTSDDFKVNLEENTMKKKWNKGLVTACAAAVIALTGTTVYAQNVGGIQRKMQIWRDGELTTATVDFSDDGSYTAYDAAGNEIGSGGGVAYEGPLNKERPLTADELAEELADEMSLDESDGKYYLCWHNKKVDITDDFGEDGYAYVLLKDGDETQYVTVTKDGALSSSPDRYLIPGKDVDLD